MSWRQRNPFSSMLILAVVAIVGFEGWMLWRTRTEAYRVLTTLDQKKSERDALQQRLPQPTAETVRLTTDDVTAASARLLNARSALLQNGGRSTAPASMKSIDAYFEIARFVERERAAARRLNIAIGTDEHFGFKSNSSAGPDAGILPVVLDQRVAVENLIDALFTAGPASLISVQRERPLALLQRKAGDQGRKGKDARMKPESRGDEPADFFDPVQSVSLRVPGKIETGALKVEFSGATRVLRQFLNLLASSEVPFFVRSVEVEPLTDFPKTANGANASPAPTPIVMSSLSRFRVTVELLDPMDEAEGAAR